MSAICERLTRPFVALWLFAICIAMYPYSPSPATDVKWLLVVCATPLLLILLSGQYSNSRQVHFSVAGFALFASVVWLAIAALGAHNRGIAAVAVVHQFAYFVLFLAGRTAVQDVAQFRAVAAWYLAAIGIAALYGFIQRAGLDPFPWDPAIVSMQEYRNLPSTFGNPNLAGHALVIAIVVGVYLAMRRRWFLIPLALAATHLLMTHHRAGILALAGAAILTVSARAAKRRMGVAPAWMFIGAVVSAGVLFALLVGVAANWFGALPTRDGAFILRANSFYCAARMAADSPLVGHGTGNYEIASVPYWTAYEQENFARADRYDAHAHSEYLNHAAESGLPSVFLYVVFLLALIYRGLDAYFRSAEPDQQRIGIACAALFAGFAIDSTLGFNWRAPVSGAAIALFAGCFDGALRGGAKSPKPRRIAYNVGVLLLIPLSLVASWLETQAFRSQMHLMRGKGARLAEENSAAVAELEQSHKRAPWNWVPAYEAARASVAVGDISRAKTWLDVTLALHPNYLPAQIERARFALAELGAADMAAVERTRVVASREVERLERLCPYLPEGKEFRGQELMVSADTDFNVDRKSALDRAANCFADAVAAGARDYGRLMLLAARARDLSGSTLEAFSYAKYSLEDLNAPEDAVNKFASLAIGTNEVSVGIVALRTRVAALEKHGGNGVALALSHNALARLLDAAREDRAVVYGEYEKAIATFSGRDAVWNNFYFFCLRNRMRDTFIAELAQAVRDSQRQTTDVAKAVADLFENSSPNVASGLTVIAQGMQTVDPYRINPSNEHLAYAAHVLKEAMTRASVPAISQLNVGIVLSRTGLSRDAEEVFCGLPQDISEGARRAANIELVYVYMRNDKLAEAERLVSGALTLYPNDPEIELAYARCLFKLNRLREAGEIYGALRSRLDPGDPLMRGIVLDLRGLEQSVTPDETMPSTENGGVERQ